LVWAKARSSASWWHILVDSVRGVGRTLSSNVTNAEIGSGTDLIPAINSNGFNVNVSPNATVNENATTYVAWQWQAGQGTNTTNTSGTITSTVSVNASAGFSVVTYTGNATAGATVGHGLGVAPAMVIAKQRSSSGVDWIIYNKNLPSASYTLSLNSTAAQDSTNFTTWNGTAPSSSLITLGSSVRANANAVTYVAYCWAEIAGYSAFGSYTGNGSADGVFVYTGFRPKFVMIKRSSDVESWVIEDTSRDPYNLTVNKLYANSSGAEDSGNTYGVLDIVSNGFKLRASHPIQNASGSTYIYACWAENPFKNSLAR
jgi:hypothetical protein